MYLPSGNKASNRALNVADSERSVDCETLLGLQDGSSLMAYACLLGASF